MALLQVALSALSVTLCRAMFGAGQGQYLTSHTTDRAADQWASGVVFNLMCISQQEWRPAALLGICMAQASTSHTATRALQAFTRELECLMVYMAAALFKRACLVAVVDILLSSMRVGLSLGMMNLGISTNDRH